MTKHHKFTFGSVVPKQVSCVAMIPIYKMGWRFSWRFTIDPLAIVKKSVLVVPSKRLRSPTAPSEKLDTDWLSAVSSAKINAPLNTALADSSLLN